MEKEGFMIEVMFLAKDPRCVSMKPVRFMFNTNDENMAINQGFELLKSHTEHYDRYKARPSKHTLHEIP